MRLRERTATTLARGQWCNLCGCRLERNSSYGRGYGFTNSYSPSYNPSSSRAPISNPRRVEWLEPSGSTSVWSLCPECYRHRMRCHACGRQVGEHAVMLEGEAQIYCRDCFEQRPRCDTCGRPVGAHYWTRQDGRKLCDRCQSTSVTDPAVARVLYRRVRAELSRRLGMELREPCKLEMVSRKQLLQLIDKSSLHSLDADSRGRCFGIFMREGRHRAIFIEYGLPQIVLLEVVAHEYAHAWQSENCLIDVEPEVQEGFAEWVAYKLLEGWGCWRRSSRMLRRDDVYGMGLRMVLQWERHGGVAEVFRRVKSEA